MINNDKRSGFKWGLGVAIIGFALAWLLGIAGSQEQAQKDKLAELHSAELSACWSEVNQHGGTCRIEYLKDRTDTIYGAKVIREAE
jgi:hypothetical protein